MAGAARGGRGGRRREKDSWAGPEEIPFTIPLENNLARIHLEKLDLFGELKKVSRDETSRHDGQISGAMMRPVTPVRSGVTVDNFSGGTKYRVHGVAKLPEKRTKSVPSTLQRVSGSQHPEPSSEPAAAPKKKPGLSRAFVLPSNDPLAYHNPHEARRDAVKSAIRHQERLLEAARSRSTPTLPQGDMLQVFRWDRVPVAFDVSEYQAANFPRSIRATRACGGGRDPALTRNWGDYEKWREATLFTKNAMGKPKI